MGSRPGGCSFQSDRWKKPAWRVPENLIPSNIRAATLRIQGRNLYRWTEFYGIDPEAFEDGSAEVLFRQEYYNLPPFRTFLFSVKVDF